jgi:competence protein ComEA
VIRGNARGSVATPEPTGAVAAGPINLNTADASQLESLPGIGEVLSQAIIDYRTDNGPFATVDELEAVSGIGPTTLENVRDLVTV